MSSAWVDWTKCPMFVIIELQITGTAPAQKSYWKFEEEVLIQFTPYYYSIFYFILPTPSELIILLILLEISINDYTLNLNI